MTSPTAAISTEHVDKSLPGSTDSGTDSTGTTKSDQTTLPDHDNMHAGTLDTATTPEKGTTPTDGKYAEVKKNKQIKLRYNQTNRSLIFF